MKQMASTEDWIEKKIESLKTLYSCCIGKQEEALASYTVCLVRLLNNLVQIQKTSLHRYESQILVQPMRLFSDYFEKEVSSILEIAPEEIADKEEKIEDIERSICRVADIYENVINGTANTDKQMFLSMPINSSVYSLSPQLYARYSEMIQNLVVAFDDPGRENHDVRTTGEDTGASKEKVKYAFLLNPTMSRRLWAELLFQEREEQGKVIIIDIPVSILEEYRQLCIYIIHEIFHVLTAAQRNRKKRAAAIIMQIVEEVGFLLLENVDIPQEERNRLLELWFGDFTEKITYIYNCLDDKSKLLYARNIARWIEKEMIRSLLRIRRELHGTLLGLLKEQKESESQNEFISYYEHNERLLRAEKTILKNISDILDKRIINYILNRVIFIFKETYADVACLSILSKEMLSDYKRAFEASMQYRVNPISFSADCYRIYRQSLVETVISFEAENGSSITETARRSYRKLRSELNASQEKAKKAKNSREEVQGTETKELQNSPEEDAPTTFYLTEKMYVRVIQYLYDCKSALKETIKQLKGSINSQGKNEDVRTDKRRPGEEQPVDRERRDSWKKFYDQVTVFMEGNTQRILYGERENERTNLAN